MSLIEVDSLHLQSATQSILHQFNFQMEPGERIGILGISGSGKSSFLKFVMGSIPSGLHWEAKVAKLFGRNYKELGDEDWIQFRKYKLGYLPQNPNFGFHPRFSLETQIQDYVEKVLGKSWDPSHYDTLTKNLGIQGRENLLSARSSELSGGEKQRILLSLLFYSEPEILVADEPTSALDEETRDSVAFSVNQFLLQTKAAFLLVTHDIILAKQLTNRLVFINGGAIVDTISKANGTWENSNHEYSKAFLDVF